MAKKASQEWTLVKGDLDTRPPAARVRAKEEGTFGEAAALYTRPEKPVFERESFRGTTANRERLKAAGLFGVELPFAQRERRDVGDV